MAEITTLKLPEDLLPMDVSLVTHAINDNIKNFIMYVPQYGLVMENDLTTICMYMTSHYIMTSEEGRVITLTDTSIVTVTSHSYC